MFIQSKYKFAVIFLVIIFSVFFLGSCKPYKSVLEKEKENELITNSIKGNYEIENIYKINKKTTLELKLQEGKKYKFQYFSDKPMRLWGSTYTMILLNSELDTVLTNHISHGEYSSLSRTLIFDCMKTGVYYLKVGKEDFIAIASKSMESEYSVNSDEYVFMKKYHSVNRNYTLLFKNGIVRHACIFSKGTTYKFVSEKGMTSLRFYENNRKKSLAEFHPNPKEKEFLFKCNKTTIYFLEIINRIDIKDSLAVTSLYFNLSESRESKLKLVSEHQINKKETKITKEFAEDTTYFFKIKGGGEAIKVEILEGGIPYNLQEFEFKSGNERFIFKNQKEGIYYIKVTKKNPEDNHETTLIIEQ